MEANLEPSKDSPSTSNKADTTKRFPLPSHEDRSAVDRVFNTTEILESILMHLPFLFDRPMRPFTHLIYFPGDVAGIAGYSEPENLFRIERVCHRFRNTIRGSPLLLRLMFLAPLGDSFVYDWDPGECSEHYQRSPLYWFMRVARFDGIDEIGVNRFETRISSMIEMIHNEKCCNEHASWRGVRLIHYLKCGPITMDYRLKKHFDAKDTNNSIKLNYTETRIFDANSTLGDMFDATSEIYVRGCEEHAKAAVETVVDDQRW